MEKLVMLATVVITFQQNLCCAQAESREVGSAGRVVNGSDATPHEFPSIVGLQGASGSHSCGGSILNRKWIVTAAHCVLDSKGNTEDPSYFRVVVGDHDRSKKETSEQILQVERIIAHEKYLNLSGAPTLWRVGYDVALIQVRTEIRFNDKVLPTNLPWECKSYSPGEAWIAGWGLYEVEPPGVGPFSQRTRAVQKPANILQKKKVHMLPDAECIDPLTMKPLNKRLICFSNEGGGACSGDSGGPMYIRSGSGDTTWTQVGITSAGTKGCDAGLAIYTKISHFKGWITRRISGCGNYAARKKQPEQR